MKNALYFGDNLSVLKKLSDKTPKNNFSDQ